MIIPTSLKIDSQRLRDDFDDLAEIGATLSGGVSRLALSNEDLEARAWFANRIEEAGLFVRDDEVGNLSGVLFSQAADAKTLLIGSHLDTVPNGGHFDGTIGVLAGLECLRTIKESSIDLPFHLEVINFTDEEGSWQSFFGSMGLTGILQETHINDAQQDNAAFRAALFRAGIRPTEVHRAKRQPETIAGYLELHIEQGDRLAQANVTIGVVTGIVGRTTYNITYYGEATHAATTNMVQRRDALQGAAQFITGVHQMIQQHYPGGVVNCGNVNVQPGTFSVVPAQVSLLVECRHPDQTILADMQAHIAQLAKQCAENHRLGVEIQLVLQRPAANMHPALIDIIERVCEAHEQTYMHLVSYAGHDAQILSPFTPSAMIFIPSANGISHNPKEHSEWASVETGATILLQTILQLAQTPLASGLTP